MDKLQHAINLYQTGYIQESEFVLREIIEIEPNNETAWWWLSAVTNDPQRQIHCLQQVLRINPFNRQAGETLAALQPGDRPAFGPESDGRNTAPSVVNLPAERPMSTLVEMPASKSRRRRREEGFLGDMGEMKDQFAERITEILDDTLGERKSLVIHLVVTFMVAIILNCVCAWSLSAFPSSFATAVIEDNQPTTVSQSANPNRTEDNLSQSANSRQPADPNQSEGEVSQPMGFQVLTVTATVFTITWLTYIGPFLIASYFVVGYQLNGTWPHSQLFRMILNLVLGRSRTLRRHLTLTLIVTLLLLPTILSSVSGLYLVPLELNNNPNQYYEIGIRINLIISLIVYAFVGFVFVYYLLAYVNNWQITDDTAHYLFDNQVDKAESVYDEILKRMEQRELPFPYTVKFVTFTEKGNQSLTEFTETTQLEITYKRARVAVRILEYGNDLYIRWDSYLDLSARRLSLLIGLFTSFLNGIVIWLVRQSIYEFIMILWGILAGKGFKSQGSQALPFSTILSPAYVDWSFIPSYMIDDLYALEEAVNKSTIKALREIALQASLEAEIEMPIQRSRGSNQTRLF